MDSLEGFLAEQSHCFIRIDAVFPRPNTKED